MARKLNVNDVIVRPIITEKSSQDMMNNKYHLQINVDATKTDVKRAVETIFAKSEAKVSRVNMMNVRGKKARVGKYEGRKAAYKKAIVSLSAGMIPVFGEAPAKEEASEKKAIKVIDTEKIMKEATGEE